METMKNEYPVAAMTEALEVSKSGFFAHRHKEAGPRRQEDARLAAAIEPIFEESWRSYGSPRVVKELRARGQRGGKNRVARLMREAGLHPKQKRRWRPTTTDSNHRQPIAENWLAKMPAPARPDQVWVADITYIDTGEGWLYLAGLLDACSRCCVGWQTGESLDAALVTQAWEKACRDRRPGPGLLHHSDRGVQYASGAMAALLAKSGAAASMSRRGNCYDNAMMEGSVYAVVALVGDWRKFLRCFPRRSSTGAATAAANGCVKTATPATERNGPSAWCADALSTWNPRGRATTRSSRIKSWPPTRIEFFIVTYNLKIKQSTLV